MIPDLDERLTRNLDAVLAEIDAPPRSRLERVLMSVRVPEPTARLVASTPALRAAWVGSVLLVLALAASVGDASWSDASRLAVVLALAPVVPVLGVALAYGPHADRSHEVAVAAPMSGLRLLLLRAVTVLVAASILTAVVVLIAPGAGWLRLAWLLPSLATTSSTLALGARFGIQRAAAAVTGAWLTGVVVAAQVADDAAAPFGVVGQVVAAAVATAATGAFVVGRHRLDVAPPVARGLWGGRP